MVDRFINGELKQNKQENPVNHLFHLFFTAKLPYGQSVMQQQCLQQKCLRLRCLPQDAMVKLPDTELYGV